MAVLLVILPVTNNIIRVQAVFVKQKSNIRLGNWAIYPVDVGVM